MDDVVSQIYRAWQPQLRGACLASTPWQRHCKTPPVAEIHVFVLLPVPARVRAQKDHEISRFWDFRERFRPKPRTSSEPHQHSLPVHFRLAPTCAFGARVAVIDLSTQTLEF
jgi:hypothetical protein